MSADAYLQARDVFKEAEAKLKAVSTHLSAVVQHLEHAPGQFMFANAPGGFPAEVLLGRHVSMDAHQWPTPVQINALLVEWHDRRGKMLSAWQAIPESQRTAFQPPFAAPARRY